MQRSYDVVIVGGGIIGSATAYFLAANSEFNGRVLVLEKDQTYARAATTLSAASIRQQFSSQVNIQISQFGIEFLRSLADHLTVDGDVPAIGLRERSYVYLASEAGADLLRENIAFQKRHGVDVVYLSPEDLVSRFPWMAPDGIAAASTTTSGEGWFDSYALLQAFRHKARRLGVVYETGAVARLLRDATGSVSGVSLTTGEEMRGKSIVSTAGTDTPRLLSTAELHVPVSPRKRCVFVFDCGTAIPDCPLVIDPSGLYFRGEGERFICGLPPAPDPDVDPDDFDVDYNLFDERIWPLLAARVPAFEAIRPAQAWAGHYDYNNFDQNAIIGHVPDAPNLLVATGFSGHGLQQAPAVGRGLAELITFGAYRSLDLSPLSYARLQRNEPLIERNVI